MVPEGVTHGEISIGTAVQRLSVFGEALPIGILVLNNVLDWGNIVPPELD